MTVEFISRETRALNAQPRPNMQTVTIKRAASPLVVDIWEPAAPSNEAPILLVHGWGGSGSYWRRTASDLSATNRVIVPDLPGTGRSQPVSSTHNMFDQVDALRDLLDRLDIDRVQIIGHSMGGAMTLLLADAQPERVERVVLTSVSFFLDEAQIQIYRTIMATFKATFSLRNKWLASMPGVPQMMATRYFYRIPKDEKLLRQGLLDYLELDAGTASACADDAPHPAIPAAGSRLQAPALLVACRQDQVMPVENVDYTAGIIPNCEVRWIEQCGHLPMVEKPDEFLALLHDFLRLG
jgi:pimeloyl-ACP methyl ester carboxylesterase